MTVRQLIAALLDHDLDANVRVLGHEELEWLSTFTRKRGALVLGTGTYGTDVGRANEQYRADRRRGPPRKAARAMSEDDL